MTTPKTLQELSIEEIKASIYDAMVNIQNSQLMIKELEGELKRRYEETPKPTDNSTAS
jgi:phosphoribosyl-ATP pyrophosphohydrolase